MNFKVIEGGHDDFSSIYNDFKHDYLNTDLTNNEIKRKYNLSQKKFIKLCKLVKQNNGLDKRPCTPRNYYKHDTGYSIIKRINGEKVYLGHVPTRELAIKATALCRQVNWDIEKSKLEIMKVKKCQ